MVEPVSPDPLRPLGPVLPGRPASAAGRKEADHGFAAALREQLERVSTMQREAEQGVEDLLAGRTQNITDVFVAARKAEVAFGLLMEIRNKLADAYTELKNLRV